MIEVENKQLWRFTIVKEKDDVFVVFCRKDILCEPIREKIGVTTRSYSYEVIPCEQWETRLLGSSAPEFIIKGVLGFLKQHAPYERVSRV